MTILQRCAQRDLRGDYYSRVGTLPGAILSADSMRRYLLWRAWGSPSPDPKNWMLWVMLNPSTADGRTNDPTIRKCVEFTTSAGCAGFEVVNLISQRSPKPGVVRAEEEPDDADRIIALAFARCSRIVCGWGTLSGLSKPARKIAQQRIEFIRGLERVTARCAPFEGRKLECLSVTKNGQPGHPLYIPYSAKLSPWEPS